ncbi:MAG: hypothetical protein Q7V31_16020 [Parvibaculum sp.]|uniref:hypothetical protein n=1 Tax=Parvibaculum sp. TaxID=2024848 RepID=UPI0027235B78|nr:hypothetical protein [Parvibaculum sp.]MDO8840420.1 hypothetical protein [Parvibaculum sp.]
MSAAFPTCQDIFFTLAAGAEQVHAADAEMLAIISATDAFLISFDSGPFQIAQPGLSYQGRPDASGARPRFGQLRFRNPTAAPIDIVVQVSNGDIFDNRAIFGTGSVPVVPGVGAQFDVVQASSWVVSFAAPQAVLQSGAWNVGLTGTYLPREQVSVTISNTANLSCTATAVTLISAATAARARYVLEHLGTETMYIKTANTNNDNGIPIRPGERLEIEANGALNIRNPAAFAQTIRRAEITW